MIKQTRDRRNFIREMDAKQDSIWNRIARKLIRDILAYYTAGFSITNDGKISQSTRNISFARKIRDLQNDFVDNVSGPEAARLGRSLSKVQKLSKAYFKAVPGIQSKAVDKAFSATTSKLLDRIGFDPANSEIIKGGYLNDVAKIENVFQRVKVQALRAANRGDSLDSFRNITKEYLEKDSPVQRHYRSISGDIFSQFERESSNQARIRLKLVFAIYTGGIIGTTRPWCEIRNSKVFHISEIEKFGTSADEYGGYTDKSTGQFQGRNTNKIYDPLIDCGDVNCRHFWNWISTQLALSRRPDAKSFIG